MFPFGNYFTSRPILSSKSSQAGTFSFNFDISTTLFRSGNMVHLL
jgi:hypothetical protein